MKKHIFLMLSLCLILVWNVASYATAQALSEIKKERDAINAKVSNTQSELSALETQIAETQLKILDFDERLTIALDELDVINASMGDTEALFNRTQQELELAQQKRDRQFASYKDRVRVMYEYGSASYLDILMQATSPGEFLTQLEYLNAIAKHDNELVDRLEESERNLIVKREEVDRSRNTLEELQFRQEALTKDIEATLAEQNTLMVALLENEENTELQLAIEQEDARLAQVNYEKAKKADDDRRAEEARIAAANAERAAAERRANIAQYNGSMVWPAPQFSQVTSQYGRRTHPITGKNEMHKGVDIASPMNSDIVAADSGVVITAERNWSYGNYIVVDHGGVSTLYAHASKLLVSEGDTVSRGQVIAKVGSTGVSTGPHLHFEVQVGGAHTSPKGYLNY